MKFGTMELLLIFLIIFFVLGPEKTVLAARKLGKFLRTLKVYISSITGDLKETVEEPLKDIASPITDLTSSIQQPVKDLTNAIQQPMKDLADSMEQPMNELSQGIEQPINDLNRSLSQVDVSIPAAGAAAQATAQASKTKPVEETLNLDELEVAELDEPETNETVEEAAP